MRNSKKVGQMDGANGAPGDTAAAAIEQVRLKKFSRRLYELRTEKGMSMSDLARKIWGTVTDARGYEVPRNKDRISRWERGDQVPERQNLERLAEALETTVDDLAPDLTARAIDAQPAPALSMTMIAGHPDKVHLIVNTLCSLDVAAKIVAMLSGDPLAKVGASPV